MTPSQFCYWLQGFFEISNTLYLAEWQIQILRDHLSLVFEKETPDRNPRPQQPRQHELEEWLRKRDEEHRDMIKHPYPSVPPYNPQLQQQPQVPWKLPQVTCEADGEMAVTATSYGELVYDGSNWQPPKNPFIC